MSRSKSPFKQNRHQELCSEDKKPHWYRHLTQEGVLASLQNDFKEREMGKIELQGKKVLFIGTDDQLSKALDFL